MTALRPAREAEASALTELALRAKASWGYDEDFLAACRAELTVTGADIRGGTRYFTVIEAGGRVAGFHSLRPTPEGDVELVSLFVDPPYQRQGYGSRLLAHALGVARRMGASRLWFGGDPQAAGFYQAAGAHRIGQVASGSLPGRHISLYEIQFSVAP